jgi:hypothetical protein
MRVRSPQFAGTASLRMKMRFYREIEKAGVLRGSRWKFGWASGALNDMASLGMLEGCRGIEGAIA